MWYLIGLVWLAVMAAIVYNYTRKQRRRTSERAQSMEKMVLELRASSGTQAAETIAAAASVSTLAAFTRKPRLLPQPAALLYYVFRTGLPDHEIFAGIALNDILEIVPDAQDAPQRQHLRRRLEQHRLDLVVCNRQLEVVAAVVAANNPTVASGEEARFVDTCLQSAGVRLVRIDPAAPPRHHQVQALVYG